MEQRTERKGLPLFFSTLVLTGLLILTSVPTVTGAINSSSGAGLEIKKITLPNGLRVLHLERHELPIVVVNLFIKAGSKEEPFEKAGLASLTADMLSGGTKTMKAEEISEAIEFYGASFSASTDYDYTLLSLTLLRKDLPELIKLFKELLLGPVFPDKELKKRKSILITDLTKREEKPSYVAMQTLRKEIFKDHPYGRPVDGTPESIKGIKRKDLLDFYKKFYRPENSILVIVGDINEKEVKELIEDFGKWKSVAEVAVGEPAYRRTEERRIGGERYIIINRDLTQANIVYGLPGIKRRDPDYYAASVMNYILGGGGFGSRLVQKIRDEMGLAYDVSSYFTVNDESGLFVIQLQTKNEQAKKAIGLIKEEIERLLRDGVSEEELEEAKAYLTGSLVRRLDTTKKIADFLTFAEFFGLGDDFIKRYPELIRSVTRDDIIKTVRRLLSPEGLVVIVGKEKDIK